MRDTARLETPDAPLLGFSWGRFPILELKAIGFLLKLLCLPAFSEPYSFLFVATPCDWSTPDFELVWFDPTVCFLVSSF